MTIDAGTGDNSVYNYYGHSVSVDTGAGNDYIYSNGSSVIIHAGEGNDYIDSYGDNVTIDGGDGDDYVNNEHGENVLFKYTAGAGNDTIIGFNADDTLSISGGSYSTQVSGANVIVTVGNEKIILRNVLGFADTIHINSEKITLGRQITLTVGDDFLYNSRDSVTIEVAAG